MRRRICRPKTAERLWSLWVPGTLLFLIQDGPLPVFTESAVMKTCLFHTKAHGGKAETRDRMEEEQEGDPALGADRRNGWNGFAATLSAPWSGPAGSALPAASAFSVDVEKRREAGYERLFQEE